MNRVYGGSECSRCINKREDRTIAIAIVINRVSRHDDCRHGYVRHDECHEASPPAGKPHASSVFILVNQRWHALQSFVLHFAVSQRRDAL